MSPTSPCSLDGGCAVLFVDTWEKLGRKAPSPAQAWRLFTGQFLEAYQSVANTIGYQAVKGRYPSLTQLDDTSLVDAETLTRFYGCEMGNVRVEDDESGEFTQFSNPAKIYHKIRGCQDLLERSSQEFDAILRIRPDKSLEGVEPAFDWSWLIEESQWDRTLFADFEARCHQTSGLVVGD